jgi:hypothetical protein
MKQTVKLGAIVVSEIRTINRDGVEVTETFKPFEIKDIEVTFEISAEEMLQQMSNFKEFCKGTLELYKIIKGELASGEVTEMVKDFGKVVTAVRQGPTPAEEMRPEV